MPVCRLLNSPESAASFFQSLVGYMLTKNAGEVSYSRRLGMNVQRIAPGILTLLLTCFGISSAQEGPAGTLKSTTRLVIVDVVATNSKGEPITDLRAQDFKVLENGREQDIRVFEFQRPESQRSDSVSASGVRPAKPSARVVSNAPAYKPGSSMNVVLLDLLNTANPRQNFARD